MFDNINDIRKAMYDFQTKHRKYPNVIFIPRAKRRQFIEEAYYSSVLEVYSPIRNFLEDFSLLGVKVKWTENTDGVDWIEEFQNVKPEPWVEPVKVKSTSRKIVL